MNEQERKIVEQALSVLEAKDTWGSSIREAKENAITSLRQCLASKTRPATREEKIVNPGMYEVKVAQQPVRTPKREPEIVGRITDNIKGMVLRQEVMLYTNHYLPIGTALYTHPQPKREWVGLTRNEAMEIIKSLVGQDWIYVVDAIEAKLKLKNGYAEEKNT